MATQIVVSVTGFEHRPATADSHVVTIVSLEWEAARAPRLFPLMKAELKVYPLTATETQLDFSGTYEPPLGLVGSAADALLGHRIAEATVHRFVTDIGHFLRQELKRADPGP